jgi:hypothetical protein
MRPLPLAVVSRAEYFVPLLRRIRGVNNTDHSQRNVSDQSIQTGQGSGQADAQIRAYFLLI